METLEQILAKVESILVDSMQMSPEQAKAYLERWTSEQLLLEADLIKELVKFLPPDEGAKLAGEHSAKCIELADQMESRLTD